MRRRNKNRRSNRYDEREDINPMNYVSNLSDVMLVFAVGLMLSLILHWNVKITAPDASDNKNRTEEAVEFDENDLEDMEEIPENMNKMGDVYYDPIPESITLLQIEKAKTTTNGSLRFWLSASRQQSCFLLCWDNMRYRPEISKILWSKLPFGAGILQTWTNAAETILFEVRLPRVGAAVLIGLRSALREYVIRECFATRWFHRILGASTEQVSAQHWRSFWGRLCPDLHIRFFIRYRCRDSGLCCKPVQQNE